MYRLGEVLGTSHGRGIVRRAPWGRAVKLVRLTDAEREKARLLMALAGQFPSSAFPLEFVTAPGSDAVAGFAMEFKAGATWADLHALPLSHKAAVLSNLFRGLADLHAGGVTVGDFGRRPMVVHQRSLAVSFVACDRFGLARRLEDGSHVTLDNSPDSVLRDRWGAAALAWALLQGQSALPAPGELPEDGPVPLGGMPTEVQWFFDKSCRGPAERRPLPQHAAAVFARWAKGGWPWVGTGRG